MVEDLSSILRTVIKEEYRSDGLYLYSSIGEVEPGASLGLSRLPV